MSKNWVVLFDSEGLDSLVPWDDLTEELVMAKLSGTATVGMQRPVNVISRIMMRAQLNPQRSPEVWSYSTADDMDVNEMQQLWINTPQGMADLIRSKGNQLFGSKPGTKKSPVIV